MSLSLNQFKKYLVQDNKQVLKLIKEQNLIEEI
jgi:hypothetical protein